MKLLYLTLTLLLFSAVTYATDDETAEKYSWFQECPKEGEPLTCECFKKHSYWKQVSSLQQAEKDKMLGYIDKRTAFRANFDKEDHAHMRNIIAGWVCAGTDPNGYLFYKPLGYSLLLYPIINNDLELAKILLEHKANANSNNGGIDRLPLYHAKNKAMADLLVQYGAKVDGENWFNDNVLHWTVIDQTKEADLIDFCIAQGISVNAKNLSNETALHKIATMCTERSNIDLQNTLSKVRSLLKAGIDIDAKNGKGKTAQDIVQDYMQKYQNVNCLAADTCELLKAIYDAIEEGHKK